LYKRRLAGDAKRIGIDRVYYLGFGCYLILYICPFCREQIKPSRGSKRQNVGIVRCAGRPALVSTVLVPCLCLVLCLWMGNV